MCLVLADIAAAAPVVADQAASMPPAPNTAMANIECDTLDIYEMCTASNMQASCDAAGNFHNKNMPRCSSCRCIVTCPRC